MRPEHAPVGDPCTRCGMAAARHRKRTRARADYWRERSAKRRREGIVETRRIVGIDGEGYTSRGGEHRYVYMAACDEQGLVSELADDMGLSTRAVFDWLLALPATSLNIGYSLGYDRTKWLEGMPDGAIYMIEHPEKRQGAHGPLPVQWGRYRVNLVATRFSLSQCLDGENVSRRTVWDLFRFFQSSLVGALRKWKVGTEKDVDRIERMKGKRGAFKGIGRLEREYCQSECRHLAMLGRELLTAHESENLPLKTYYGPGSTAGIILKRTGAKEQNVTLSEDMVQAVDCAFFGGRFETSHVGPIEGELFGWDIAGAYPYAFCQIPCLAHGRFALVYGESALRDAIDGQAPAVVSYRLDAHADTCLAWGPLPHRLPDGNIVYPVQSAGGWAWNVELRAALKLHPGIKPLAAWVWRTDCDHPAPFRQEFVDGYCRRLSLGKTSRGHTVRLGYNSAYGKSAQQVGGGGSYRCMVRAGLITAMTRAMLLDAIALASNPWNVLELATDSILSRERLTLPTPLVFGTEEAAARAGKVPLGGWDPKPLDHGAMLLRPGMRFALGRQADADKTAARGLGVRTLHANRRRVLRAWEGAPMAPLTVQQPSLFHGARSTVRRVLGEPGADGGQQWEYRRGELYGLWERPKPRTLSYAPGPKRSGIMASPLPGCTAIALVPWRLPQTPDGRSVPYGGREEDDLLRVLAEEQPEAGYLDFV